MAEITTTAPMTPPTMPPTGTELDELVELDVCEAPASTADSQLVKWREGDLRLTEFEMDLWSLSLSSWISGISLGMSTADRVGVEVEVAVDYQLVKIALMRDYSWRCSRGMRCS